MSLPAVLHVLRLVDAQRDLDLEVLVGAALGGGEGVPLWGLGAGRRGVQDDSAQLPVVQAERASTLREHFHLDDRQRLVGREVALRVPAVGQSK